MMKAEQKANVFFLILGLIVGILSRQFDTYIYLTIAIAVYIISLIGLRGILRVKKVGWYFSNSLTYFLVWILVWILLFNQ